MGMRAVKALALKTLCSKDISALPILANLDKRDRFVRVAWIILFLSFPSTLNSTNVPSHCVGDFGESGRLQAMALFSQVASSTPDESGSCTPRWDPGCEPELVIARPESNYLPPSSPSCNLD